MLNIDTNLLDSVRLLVDELNRNQAVLDSLNVKPLIADLDRYQPLIADLNDQFRSVAADIAQGLPDVRSLSEQLNTVFDSLPNVQQLSDQVASISQTLASCAPDAS